MQMQRDFSGLSRFYIVVATVLFLVLLGRLVQLQVFSKEKYWRESERNRIRDVIIEPPRGLIFDRHGEILVDNRPAYSISVVPYEILRSDSALSLLASICTQPKSELTARIEKKMIGNFTPIKIKRQIGFNLLSSLEEHRLDLPGVFYSTELRRSYPADINASHILGYIGELDREEYRERKNRDYRLGDLVGKQGVEFRYEEYLRGKAGVQYVEVDVLGREIRELPELSSSNPQPGKNLYLTVDSDLQRYLEQRMEGMLGAAVVLDSRNGEVLALLSKPDYDPSVFSNIITENSWKELVNHKDKPLYNRAIQSVFPPGSTYKLVLAAAGLETGKMDLTETVFCNGFHLFGRRTFDCWKAGGHGNVDFLTAIEQSCNVYFFNKMLEVGLDDWTAFSRGFRFGQSTRIDLRNESRGLVPSRFYFDQKYGKKRWTRGLELNLAVGQGDLLATPLQMAYFAMILGNEGKAFQPHLVRIIEDPETGQIVRTRKDSVRIQGVSSETFKLVKQGMFLVVNGEHGTGRAARISGVEVCGKTGTAQNPHGEDHAWFIGFAPREQPEIAFSILVEKGGSGGAIAAPIARGLLKTYFDFEVAKLGDNRRK